MLTSVFAVVLVATTSAAALPGVKRTTSATTANTNVVNTPAENKCNYVGGSQCCNSVDYASPSELESLLSVLNLPISLNTLVGHGCSPLIGLDSSCNAQAVCCDHMYEGIGISCNNIIL
ncbi:hypothetical protein BDV98DRAFT_558054 [Pterulicium gracile]|uniref:Hydrophobin n=1 Tax=Pterulicium gracile TaxID=1884261 RepID=A0A5C3R1Q6_9AGAR|nr:hypothetical protein BDV98DRAFT_558054 [Pterula gracilis]